MKRILLLGIACLIASCGDGIEAKLTQCKTAMRANLKLYLADIQKQSSPEKLKLARDEQLKDTHKMTAEQKAFLTDLAKKIAGGQFKAFAATTEGMMEDKLATLPSTEAGLAECNKLLANSRKELK